MTDLPLKFGDLTLSVPSWWFDGLLLLLTLVGLMLWLFGKRFVKPTFSALGIFIGLLCVLTVLQLNFPSASPIPWLIAGAVIGLLIGLLLWRFSMAVVFMFAVIITAPVAVMTFQSIDGPNIVEPFVYQLGEAKKIVLDSVQQNAANESDAWDTSQLLSLTEPLRLAYTEAWQNAQVWWQEIESGQQWLLTATSLGGGLLAFVFGIALPGVAASLVTSLIGVLMMMTGLMRLTDGPLPQAIVNILPHQPRSIMLTIGVAMIIGALLQWTFFRKSADKSE